jgi:putative hemolysin
MQLIAQQTTKQRLPATRPRLKVEPATSPEEIRASQRLRYQIFAEEMGAQLASADEGLDRDRYDDFCQHLLIKDTLTGQVVGSTRILPGKLAEKAGGFYSEGEFDLSGLLPLPGRVIEVGRTCIHPDYRKGRALTLLWASMARYMDIHQVDYMFGCASIPMNDGGYQAHSIMEALRSEHLSDEALRVTPQLSLPDINELPSSIINIPPLLKAYLRLGLKVCGEACWDPDFNVADVFVLLDRDNIGQRYTRQYLGKSYAGLSA